MAVWAQPYYSRSINEFGIEHSLRGMALLPERDMVFNFIKNVSNRDPEPFGISCGLLRVNFDWSLRDTFWYPRGWTSYGSHNPIVIEDTIINLMHTLQASANKDFFIWAHHLITKDSLYQWRYSLSSVPMFNYFGARLLSMTSEGFLVVVGQYETSDGPFNSRSNYFLYEIGMDGMVIRKCDSLFSQPSSHVIAPVFANKLLVDKDHYYLLTDGEGDERHVISVTAIKRSDLTVHWKYDAPRTYSSGTNKSLSFSRDSQQLYLSYIRGLSIEEWLEFEELPLELWPSQSIPQFLVIDKNTGVVEEQFFQYYPLLDSLWMELNTALTSKANGDYYVAGAILVTGGFFPDSNTIDRLDYGMVMRVDPGKSIKWRLKVIDDFQGNHLLTGARFNNMVEADNGDLILTGSGFNWAIPSYGSFGWVVRMSADGCEDNEFCYGDTLSMVGFVSSTESQHRLRFERTLTLKLSPNPADRGGLVQVVPYNEESPDIIQEVVWYDMSGRPVHRQVADSPYGALEANQLRVPDTLPPGIYQLELLAGRYQRYHGRLVVR
jgi:hypothetical protein